MKPTFKLTVTTVTLTLLTFAATAQKPRPSSDYEIKLPQAQKGTYLRNGSDGYIAGNMKVSEETGKPTAIFQGTYHAKGANPEAKAREYLTANKELLGLTITDIDGLRLHSSETYDWGSVVRLRQTYKGLVVNNNAEITLHINSDNVVDFVMNGFQYGINLPDITPRKTVASARQQVFAQLRLGAADVDDETDNLMVLHYNNNDYLVHQIQFTNSQDRIGQWEAYVDAKTGEFLKLEDISCYDHAKTKKKKVDDSFLFTNTLFPKKQTAPESITALVNGTATLFDPDPLSKARVMYGTTGYTDNNDANSVQMTALLAPVVLRDITQTGSTYTLVGPYAQIIDFEAPAKGLFPQASSNFNCDRNDDRFEAAMCYYHVDVQMRHLVVDLGMNFLMPHQYSGGAKFDPSGFNGDDNSHYISSSGRVAMGEGGVDDAEDLDVVTHEMGHGLHDWATNGGLSQVEGLSEGTGDYNSGTYSRTKGNWLTSDAQYNWQYNWDGHNEFWAGRDLNYSGVYPAGLDPGGEVHMSGRIWAYANLRIAAAIGRDRSDNVFWKGLATTNGSTNQPNAALAVYNMAMTLGYTNAERFSIRQSYITAGYPMPAMVILPVKLSAFEAKKNGNQTLVSWKTASEDNSAFFFVERSADGINFTTIGNLPAAGSSTTERSYTLTDVLPLTGKNYYRLRSVNVDGSFEYSKIVSVSFDKTSQLEIYPNPVHDALTIKNAVTAGTTIHVYDVNGKQVYLQKITTASNSGTTINLAHLPDGMYVVKVNTGSELLQTKFLKE